MKKVKDGDILKTKFGVILEVIEKDGILYLKNKLGGTVSHFSNLVVPFEIIKED